MALSQEMQTILTRIDTFSTNVATEIQAVSDRITALIASIGTGMSAADVTTLQTALSSDADKLDAAASALTTLASDPNNPTPVATPPAPAP